ncbi:MAG: carboxypeptidase regulatory-like domain-containing protein, partial [bacterium]
MKRTVSLVALLLVALPAVMLAYPGIGGGRGLLRVQNALVEDEAGLTISVHALGRNPKFPVAGPKTRGWVADVIAPELSYAPLVTKYVALELFSSWGGVFQTPKTEQGGGFTMSTHDLKAGGKLSVPVLPVLKLGFTGNYTFTSGRAAREGTTWLDQYALPQAGTGNNSPFAWAALATVQLQDVLPTMPNLMFNYGKINDETRYGLGIELAGRGFALFGEILSRQTAISSGIFDTDSGNVYLTPGVVFGNVSAVSFKAAYSFALGEKANNELIAGFSLATPFGARAKPQYGTITGRVTDEKTGAMLRANVEFPEDDEMPGFTTDASGVFEVKKVLTGVTVVKVGARGYQSQSVPLDVRKGAVTMHEFKLRPLAAYGVIAGGVIDATTKKPLAARISIPGTEVPEVDDDPATGTFKVENVPVGVYTVSASADGYYPGSQTVAVEEDKVASARFELVSTATKRTALSGKVSDKATGKALAGTV